MKSKFSVLSLLLLILVLTQTSFAAELVDKAVSENAAESAAAIEELRSLGPAGLNELRVRYADQIKKHIGDPLLKPDAEWTRITKALDTVSGQKNSYIGGLYWYTDLKEAEKAVRTAIIEEEVDCSHADAAQIAEQWDQIDAKVKEAMRGL